MREVPLTVVNGGINRLRTKGGARADDLYDLLNGYVTEENTVKVRPGTDQEQVLNPSTKGLVAFGGSFHVFSNAVVDVPDGYVLHVLSHPDSPGVAHTIAKIHFASPFLGYLYVVAEFDDGLVRHFWLQAGDTWAADTVYLNGDVVEPSVVNGIVYKATRNGSTYPSWKASVARAVGDRIEPTVYNGYYYECIDVLGSNPTSGTTEPNWPTTEGTQIIEDTQGVEAGSSTNTTPDSNVPGSGVTDRYG